MTAQTLPNVGIKSGYIDDEVGWGPDMNANLRMLDAVLQLRVVDKDLSAPPGSPVAGSVYIVGPTPSGAWAGHADHLAVWRVGDDLTASWFFVVPKSGWKAWLIDETADYRFSGSAWAIISSGGGSAPAGVEWATEKTDNYQPVLSEANKAFSFNKSTIVAFSLITNSVIPFPIGTTFLLYQAGVGELKVVPEAGVTVRKRGGGDLSIAGQYGMATLIKRATDEWVLSGDLVA